MSEKEFVKIAVEVVKRGGGPFNNSDLNGMAKGDKNLVQKSIAKKLFYEVPKSVPANPHGHEYKTVYLYSVSEKGHNLSLPRLLRLWLSIKGNLRMVILPAITTLIRILINNHFKK